MKSCPIPACPVTSVVTGGELLSHERSRLQAVDSLSLLVPRVLRSNRIFSIFIGHGETHADAHGHAGVHHRRRPEP